jgi:hypothetical protein
VSGAAFFIPGETGAYFMAGCPGGKPHQRLGWTFHLGGGPYIDLAVMPRVPDIDMTAFAKADGLAAAGKVSATFWGNGAKLQTDGNA